MELNTKRINLRKIKDFCHFLVYWFEKMTHLHLSSVCRLKIAELIIWCTPGTASPIQTLPLFYYGITAFTIWLKIIIYSNCLALKKVKAKPKVKSRIYNYFTVKYKIISKVFFLKIFLWNRNRNRNRIKEPESEPSVNWVSRVSWEPGLLSGLRRYKNS